ncbi:MAG: hypothetical protein JEZ03_15825 [Bacteroidales bacterium]|nr:hypothetical protein [Bacteroidales bacterium]
MGIKYYTVIVLFMAIIFNGCSKRGDIPSYIRIEKIELADNPDIIEGALSVNISDAWIYVNSRLIGAYELPCVAPVIADGDATIEVFAGVKMNGISNTRIKYPFYDSYKTDVTLTKEQETVITPVIQYKSNIDLVFQEDFEASTTSFERAVNSDTIFIIKNEDLDPVYGGIGYGEINLIDEQDFFEAITQETFDFMTTRETFAEIDFKTDIPIKVGLYVYQWGTPALQVGIVNLNTTEEWKKIYVNITPTINANANADNYSFFMACMENDQSDVSSKALIDNIKIIQYK